MLAIHARTSRPPVKTVAVEPLMPTREPGRQQRRQIAILIPAAAIRPALTPVPTLLVQPLRVATVIQRRAIAEAAVTHRAVAVIRPAAVAEVIRPVVAVAEVAVAVADPANQAAAEDKIND